MQTGDYEEVTAAIRNAPDTWFPALMVELLKAALHKKVWQRGCIHKYVTSIETQLLRELEKAEKGCDAS